MLQQMCSQAGPIALTVVSASSSSFTAFDRATSMFEIPEHNNLGRGPLKHAVALSCPYPLCCKPERLPCMHVCVICEWVGSVCWYDLWFYVETDLPIISRNIRNLKFVASLQFVRTIYTNSHGCQAHITICACKHVFISAILKWC